MLFWKYYESSNSNKMYTYLESNNKSEREDGASGESFCLSLAQVLKDKIDSYQDRYGTKSVFQNSGFLPIKHQAQIVPSAAQHSTSHHGPRPACRINEQVPS